MKKFDVIIVIPVYRKMHTLETISLQQAVRILNQYHICLAAPESMNVGEFLGYHDFLVENFSDDSFVSIKSYSKLLLSTAFYERFKQYEYMLIYQLDAFVFRDAIEDFCTMGYDYFGAPWRLSDTGRIITGNPVGNGGVSLRNIPHTIDVLKRYQKTIQKNENLFVYEQGEDVFFAWAGMQPDANFKTAPIYVAKTFSLECDVQHAFLDIKNHMPFAIHKWYQRDFSFWKPYIEKQGYTIDEQDPHIRWRTTTDDRLTAINHYLIRRILRYTSEQKFCIVVQKFIPIQRELYIYGQGRIGQKTVELLKKAGRHIVGFIDKKAQKGKRFLGIPELQLQDIRSENLFVIIGSTAYEDEIQNRLEEYGLKIEVDYISYRLLEKKIIEDYYLKRHI